MYDPHKGRKRPQKLPVTQDSNLNPPEKTKKTGESNYTIIKDNINSYFFSHL